MIILKKRVEMIDKLNIKVLKDVLKTFIVINKKSKDDWGKGVEGICKKLLTLIKELESNKEPDA